MLAASDMLRPNLTMAYGFKQQALNKYSFKTYRI